jgi:hypothetical protein
MAVADRDRRGPRAAPRVANGTLHRPLAFSAMSPAAATGSRGSPPAAPHRSVGSSFRPWRRLPVDRCLPHAQAGDIGHTMSAHTEGDPRRLPPWPRAPAGGAAPLPPFWQAPAPTCRRRAESRASTGVGPLLLPSNVRAVRMRDPPLALASRVPGARGSRRGTRGSAPPASSTKPARLRLPNSLQGPNVADQYHAA